MGAAIFALLIVLDEDEVNVMFKAMEGQATAPPIPIGGFSVGIWYF
jgi:hypothetical protein